MQGNGSGRFQMLAIDGAENPDVVIRAGGGANNPVVLINHLHELANNERHRLDPLDLLLGPKKLAFEILLFILDVFFLDIDEFQLALKGLEAAVEIVLVGRLVLVTEALQVGSRRGERCRRL